MVLTYRLSETAIVSCCFHRHLDLFLARLDLETVKHLPLYGGRGPKGRQPDDRLGLGPAATASPSQGVILLGLGVTNYTFDGATVL